MSTHGRVPPSDDTLARAETALRHTPIPDGLSQGRNWCRAELVSNWCQFCFPELVSVLFPTMS